jgi:hypothetical protein
MMLAFFWPSFDNNTSTYFWTFASLIVTISILGFGFDTIVWISHWPEHPSDWPARKALPCFSLALYVVTVIACIPLAFLAHPRFMLASADEAMVRPFSTTVSMPFYYQAGDPSLRGKDWDGCPQVNLNETDLIPGLPTYPPGANTSLLFCRPGVYRPALMADWAAAAWRSRYNCTPSAYPGDWSRCAAESSVVDGVFTASTIVELKRALVYVQAAFYLACISLAIALVYLTITMCMDIRLHGFYKPRPAPPSYQAPENDSGNHDRLPAYSP